MQTSDTVIIITVACGLLMVIGGMVLLYKGAITLKDSNPDEAIKVEFKHMINVTTRYPALGLFVIGLVFTVVALYSVQREPFHQFDISGTLSPTDQADQNAVVISFQAYTGHPDPDGKIRGTVHSGLENIACQIRLPGEDAHEWTKSKMDIRGGTLELGKISLQKAKTQDQPKVDPKNIESAPPLKGEN